MLQLIAKFGLGFTLPSYHEISVTFLEKEVKKTLGLFEDYKAEWKKTGCSIIFNIWENEENKTLYCNTFLNIPSLTLFVSSKNFWNPYNCLEILDEIIEKVGEENVVQVIIGNAHYPSAKYYSEVRYRLQEKWTKMFCTPCLYDCIESILIHLDVSCGFPMLQVKSIARLIYSSSMLISLMLKQFTNGEDLVRVDKSNYATTYWTMLRLKHLKQPLMNMFVSEQWKSTKFASTSGKDIQKLILNSIFWENIDEILSAVSPLIRILEMLDSHKIPIMGFIYEELSNAKKEIQRNLKDEDSRLILIS
ncbi:hypothetical protein Cni_G06363 [Canna indica]|uniref:DUF659 domain-containing protein n=1 Tax=Canna indica TaxID=4628 RepID=A0AAQ3K1B7_9LILI|nr:hypothetical protein Cni_G06363 [Canna indica]